MEIVDRGGDSGREPVQVAYADTREEAALIRGLLREAKIKSIARQAGVEGGIGTSSLLTRSPRRIYVRPEDAAAARTLLSETMVEDPAESEIPEPVNATYLEDARGHKPRDYGLIGAYARIWVVGIVVLGLVLVVFLLIHS
jgi:Putative prokaryotic signal transducing protein